jgi:hypothetical protein
MSPLGPAKWWTGKKKSLKAGPLKLLGIFADSLDDLTRIVDNVLHHSDVDADIIGIRWAPFTSVTSRFGLDPTNSLCVQTAARLISKLPDTNRIGMQMHYASSTIGGPNWFQIVKQYGNIFFFTNNIIVLPSLSHTQLLQRTSFVLC